jgi:hypothetical protein
MPVIDVYKNGSTVIPVSQAKLSKAFLCPFTNKVYATKKQYEKHLENYRKNVIHPTIVSKKIDSKIAELNNQSSWKNVISWIENNSKYFLSNGQRNYGPDKRWPNVKDFKITITLLDITHLNRVSNSHDAPRNHDTNWSGDPDKPTGYPGWHGRIEFKLSHEVPGFASTLFESTGIHLGTGGGIFNNRYGYGVTFFDLDWPGIEKQKVFDIIAGIDHNNFTFGKPDYFSF